MAGEKPIGDRVLIFDTDGYFMAAALAQKLASEGHAVRLVTALERAASYTRHTGEWFDITRGLRGLGVEVVTQHCLTQIEAGAVSGADLVSPDATVSWPTDSVVLVTQRVSRDDLYRDLQENPRLLEEGIDGVFRIGDCVSPRLIADAVFDGHRLGEEIDEDDPAVYRPYL
jgi:dimethylamine/trimethylamine dehydrogenase